MAKVLGGFQCSKYTLMGLNIFYIIVGIILICLGTEWSDSNRVTNLPIVGGIVACGVFLILISITGIFGAARHHQVLLFFYMVILFIVFIIQFSVACACLSVSDDTQQKMAEHGWDSLSNSSKSDIENSMECCKFSAQIIDDRPCPKMCWNNCTDTSDGSHSSTIRGHCCPTCQPQISYMIEKGFQIVGGVSLFFSFTEIIGACVAYRYRNLYGTNIP